jgi:anti-sigma regulatory factor (Ser/Thr protein kinase)
MHEYTRVPEVWGLTCPGTPKQISRARRWIRTVLANCPCAEEAAFVVSELATNAITHTASGQVGGTFHVTVIRSETVVMISVTDAGGTDHIPHIDFATHDATHGRGLSMVDTFAVHLDVRGDYEGRTITAVLLLPQGKLAGCEDSVS